MRERERERERELYVLNPLSYCIQFSLTGIYVINFLKKKISSWSIEKSLDVWFSHEAMQQAQPQTFFSCSSIYRGIY